MELEGRLEELERQRNDGSISEITYNLQRNLLITRSEQLARRRALSDRIAPPPASPPKSGRKSPAARITPLFALPQRARTQSERGPVEARRPPPAPPPSDRRPPEPSDGILGDDYAVGAMMGEGLVGPRFAGRYRPSGHPVALEEIPDELLGRPGFVQRLAVAVRLAAPLTAPQVVRVQDLVRVDQRLYMVTELCRGRSLAALLGPEALPLPSALTVIDSILAGLEEIHAVGMVHGDICPEVVVVTASGEVRIDGLGLAEVLAADPALSAWPAVPPPKGGAATIAADLHATGILMQQLVCGPSAGGGQWVGSARLSLLVARAADPAPEHPFASAADFRLELDRTAAGLLGKGWRNKIDLTDRVARSLVPPR